MKARRVVDDTPACKWGRPELHYRLDVALRQHLVDVDARPATGWS
jgi:hypothetical protein